MIDMTTFFIGQASFHIMKSRISNENGCTTVETENMRTQYGYVTTVIWSINENVVIIID